MNVALLVTGNVEWYGLAAPLDRLFPGHDFRMYPSDAEKTSHGEAFPFDGFTSAVLTEQQVRDPPESAVDLVSRAAQASIEGNHLVIILDDLEEHNLNAPAMALQVFRAAVVSHLASISNQRIRDRTQARLRDHVSLHLAVPMIESWFFAAPDMIRTYCGLSSTPALAGQDPEDFLTDDPAYEQATELECPCWVGEGRKRKHRPKWLGDVNRRRHSKGYLQWLCRAAAAATCTHYSEAEDGLGVTLLRRLEWLDVLGGGPARMRYLAALVDDVADALAQDPVTGQVPPNLPAPLTSRRLMRHGAVLRNV